jgi:hypothetical protein
MGKPIRWKSVCRYAVGYNVREPREVKHLSNAWKINQFSRKTDRDSVSSGERKRKYIEIYSSW